MPKKWITGIDIGRYSIKAAVLFHDGHQIILHNCIECEGSGAVYTDAHSLKYQDTVKTLRQLRKLTPRFQRQVAITVPSDAVNCRQISVPAALSPLQIEATLKQQLQPSTSQLSQALVMDYTRLPSVDNSRQHNYLVHFAHRAVIDTWYIPFKTVGYKVGLLQPHDSSAQGILQLIASQSPDYKHWGLLELGQGHISFYPPTNLPNQAKASWVLASNNSKHDIEDWLTPTMVMKINAHLQQLLFGGHDTVLEGVWLCGGGGNIVVPQLQELAQNLKLQVAVKVLRLNTLISKSSSEVSFIPPQFMLSIGCAVNALNWPAKI